ncbi:type II secretion system protein [Humisphaera borealis]|uniref:Type II secretion system protein n=1 Tax=Humisphaera borealis TaxID=2807512 RepID=A0A7M2WXT8_9BACT|nr:type II secretion system protein [Humisphaera borealis]QOV89330.1 type II secretion system protein [Humisphaera borealis]
MLPSEPKQFRAEFPHHRAFSLVELLVVLGILVILCSIFIPYVGKMRETNKRVACADNLRQIHAAFSKYAGANDRDFPRMPWDPARPGMYVAFTGSSLVPVRPATTAPTTAPSLPTTAPAAVAAIPPNLTPATPAPTTTPATVSTTPATGTAATQTIAGPPPPSVDGVKPNDVTAALWLLVRLGYVQPQAFVCASASETLDPMLTGGKRVNAAQRSNFTSGQHLSYSYCSPYSAAPRFRLNSDVLPPDFAIMADKNPGVVTGGSNAAGPAYNAPPLEMTAANSRNHDRAGQNVLYVTGEVRFQSTPYCGYGTGWKRDNIYSTFATQPLPPGSNPAPEGKGIVSPNAGPAWENDSYLVPTEDE